MNSHYCSECGQALPDASKFCPACGHPVASTATSPVPPPIKTHDSPPVGTGGKSGGRLLIASMVLLVVVLFGGAVTWAVWQLTAATDGQADVADEAGTVQAPAQAPTAPEENAREPTAEELARGAVSDPADLVPQVREILDPELSAAGLPAVSLLTLDDEVLRLFFPAPEPDGENTQPGIENAESLLMAMVLGWNAATQTGLPMKSLRVDARQPSGETLTGGASEARIREFVEGAVSSESFLESAGVDLLPWEPAGDTPQEQAQDTYARAARFLDSDQPEEALRLFEMAAELSPTHPRVNYARVFSAIKVGDLNKALAVYEKAKEDCQRETDLDAGVLALMLSKALLDKNQDAVALRIADDGLAAPTLSATSEPELLYLRSISLLRLDRPAEAELPARTLTEKFPNKAVLGLDRLVPSLIHQEKFTEAFAAARQATELDPGEANFWYLRGYAAAGLKKYQEAVTSLEESLRLAKSHGQVSDEELFIKLSYAYAQLNNVEKVVEIASAGLQHYPASEALQTNYKVGYKAGLSRKQK